MQGSFDILCQLYCYTVTALMSVYCPGRSSTISIVLLHEAGQRLYFKDLRPHLDCYCACSQPSASLAFKPFFEHAPARSELEFYAAFPLTLMTMLEHFKRHWKQFKFDNMDVAIWTRVAICVRGSNLNSTDGGCGGPEKKIFQRKKENIEVRTHPEQLAPGPACNPHGN